MTKLYIKKYTDGLIENIYSTNLDNKNINIETKTIIGLLHNFEYKINKSKYQLAIREEEYDGFATETRIFFNELNDIEEWCDSDEKYCLKSYIRSLLKKCIYSVNRDKNISHMIIVCSSIDFMQRKGIFLAPVDGKDKLCVDVSLPYPRTIATMELFNDIYQLDLSIEEEDELKYLIDRFNVIDCDALTDNSKNTIKQQYGIPCQEPIPHSKLIWNYSRRYR